ncbi:MAG: lipid II flippase MurJ, partial [Angustibacter sp.]
MKRGLLATAGVIAVITLIARAVGFGRWLVFSGAVGSGCMGTTYGTANILPNILFEVVAGGALTAAVIPLLMPRLGSSAEFSRVASALLTWTVLALVPLALILVACARPLVRLLLSAADCPGQVVVATELLTIFAVQIPLYGVGVILGGVLQAQRRFFAVALAPLLSSVVVIGGYLGYAHLAPAVAVGVGWQPSAAALWILGGTTTAGVVMLSLPLALAVLRSGVRLRPTLRLDADTARWGIRLAGGGMLALSAQQLLTVVTVVLANRSGTGALPVYQYVQAVYLLPF